MILCPVRLGAVVGELQPLGVSLDLFGWLCLVVSALLVALVVAPLLSALAGEGDDDAS